MIKQKKLWDNILTVIMALLCLLWIYPIVLILLNSLKKEGTFTTSTVFQLPTSETFAGLSNYVYGVIKMGFLSSLGYSLVITVSSVALILLCCSMTGWYLTRVNNKLSKFMNLLIVFSMVVPFQMVMFTLSKTADTLKLNTPWNICIIYLGFGAGLAVFMFTGFMKSVPMEIEEAAMIVAGNMLFQSIGKSGRATFLACCRQGVFFIPLILILPRTHGLFGVEICQPIADVLTFLVSLPFLLAFLQQLGRMDDAEQSKTAS